MIWFTSDTHFGHENVLMKQVRDTYDMRYPDGLFVSRTTQ